MKRQIVAMLGFCLLLSACGFQLRGLGGGSQIPFRSMNVEGAGPVVLGLQQYLRASSSTKLVSAKEAEATIVVLSEGTEKVIRSLDRAGKVNEYELRYSLNYSLLGANRRPLFPESNIQARRFMTYSTNEALGKENEEAMLVRDMQQDATQQILRRISLYNPKPEDLTTKAP